MAGSRWGPQPVLPGGITKMVRSWAGLRAESGPASGDLPGEGCGAGTERGLWLVRVSI